MARKRQFSGVTKPRPFFDRKVRPEGHTRTISLGKIIPKDWTYVRIRPIERAGDKITIEIEKLLGGEKNEQRTVNSGQTKTK